MVAGRGRESGDGRRLPDISDTDELHGPGLEGIVITQSVHGADLTRSVVLDEPHHEEGQGSQQRAGDQPCGEGEPPR